MARPGGRLIALTLAVATVAMPQRVSGQSSGAGADTAARTWASLALGPSTAKVRGLSTTGQLLGADLAAWRTRDKLALGIRTAWAAEFPDGGEVFDVAALAGIHPQTEPNVYAVAGLGVGYSRGHQAPGANLPSRAILAAGAQLMFNYHFVGIGLDGFGGVGKSRRYYGIGLALAFGNFR